ncbi:LysR substrate-binding domain-containing protein [Pseudomonas protegens]|uniref:LysR substrate-binding domain-containing protein n=1 Tax=Pseudomonas protegens TaxID=380021 RepID=UPI00391B301B
MRMTEALKIFRAKGPDIRVNVHMTTPSSVARGVFDGHFHIGAIPTTHRVNGLDYRPCMPRSRSFIAVMNTLCSGLRMKARSLNAYPFVTRLPSLNHRNRRSSNTPRS